MSRCFLSSFTVWNKGGLVKAEAPVGLRVSIQVVYQRYG